MWRKIKPHTDLHEVLDGWHEPFCASHRYVIDKYLYFGSQSHGNRNLAFYFIEMEQSVTKNLANADVYKVFLAPRVGLEPTTPRLTAVCSTIELSRTTSFFSCCTLKTSYRIPTDLSQTFSLPFGLLSGQAFGRLVAVRSMHCCTSTPVLSTWSSPRGLILLGDISSWGGLRA